jgi:class 3 adenylate cyclase/tetratricopeptide (TPR) repeat protein
MPLCPRCGQDNPDVARFCLACGAPLAPPQPATEERKLITVLFCDIVGSTASAEKLDPEDVRARLAPYYERARTELERFGGTVEKFIGDAVVALFGAPVAHEDDPERAVRAAFAVRQAVEDLNQQDAWLDLKIRVGINTGEALVVLGARATEGEGMASGDVMNTAARLQSAAPVDGIVVGELTYHATRDAVDFHDVEPITAKGKSEPVRVWEATALRQPQVRPSAETPLVGRKAELEELTKLWGEVQRLGGPALATVTGAPGVGKSRLVEELAQQAAATGDVYWGRCLPYGEGITYWPVADVLKAAAGILQSDDAETTSTKLGALLEGLETVDADELRTMAAAAANLLGTRATPRGTYSAIAIAQAELHWGVRRIIQLLARRRPLVLVFEDLHWAEPTLFELLRFLVDQDDTPLLVVGTARPELGETASGFVRTGGRVHHVALDALPASAGEELLEHLIGQAIPPGPAREALLQNAGGNPLFLEETARMLAASGLAAAEMEELPLPTSLQTLLAARLDQLPPSEKQVGQHASVVGRVFWPGAVAHLRENGAVNGSSLHGNLAELERRDFIHSQAPSSIEGEHEYAFKHILIRDVAYGQLPKGRRVGLHVRFAEWVKALPAGDEDFVEILGWHLEQACRLAGEVAHTPVPPPVLEAADMLARAAEKAERREGIREANGFYARGLALLGEAHPERQLALRLQFGRTLALLGELKQAYEELEWTAEAARGAARYDIRCEALVTLANVDQRRGKPSEARAKLEEAEKLAGGVDDLRLRIRIAFSLSALRADFEGDAPGAIAELRRARTLAEEVGETQLSVEGHLRLGYILFNTGDFAASEAELTRCYDLAEELGSRRDQARATFPLGLIKYYRGSLEEAERLGLQARDWLERTAEPYFQIQNFRALGLYSLARDDPEAAEQWFQQAIPIALEEGGRFALEVYRWLTEALVRQGRLTDAMRLVEFATRGAPEEDLSAQAYVNVANALIACERGERDIALEAYSEALRLFADQNVPIELGETRILFARALRRFDEPGEAKAQLELARATFAEMGADGLIAGIAREADEVAGEIGRADPARSTSD